MRVVSVLVTAPLLSVVFAVAVDAHEGGHGRGQQAPHPGSTMADSLGKRVYEERCLECHGPAGHGDGPNRWILPVRPFDLTSSHMQQEMSDEDIFGVVTRGIRERNMPSFKRRLSDDERRAVVRYVRFLGEQEDERSAATDHGDMPTDDAEHEDEHAGHEGHEGHSEHGPHKMERNVAWSMSREASGTSWLPDSTPMFGLMRMSDGTMFMFHGNIASGLDVQGSDRGSWQWTTTSWFMPMVSHDIPGGNLEGRAMFSLEPLMLTDGGYPLLLQTGETFHGQALHDRQHPHDLVMELAGMARSAPVAGISGELYAALAGEPTLGPTAFPHRVSAMGDPLGPISHHWLDSTHISYGVLTAGVGTKLFKVEGSLFNGHEPDENRFDLDLDVPQSWSVRVSAAPHENLALQASYGYLVGPEALRPDENIQRTTTSLTWNQPLTDGNWASMIAFGNNRGDVSSSAVLVESTLDLMARHTLFARGEWVGKEASELLVTSPNKVVYVPAATLGYEYSFDPAFEFVPALGVRGSAAYVGDGVAAAYGTRFPLGGMVYVAVRGAQMQMTR
jgi:mono/diheme cytochrome c family protein